MLVRWCNYQPWTILQSWTAGRVERRIHQFAGVTDATQQHAHCRWFRKHRTSDEAWVEAVILARSFDKPCQSLLCSTIVCIAVGSSALFILLLLRLLDISTACHPPSLLEESMTSTHISKRPRGRPNTRWADSIKHDLNSAGLDTTNAAQMVFDRPQWKARVSGLPTLEPEQG